MILRFRKFTKFIAMALLCSFCVCEVAYADNITDLKNEKEEAEKEVKKLEDELADLLVSIDEAEVALIEKGEEIIVEQNNLANMEAVKAEQYEQMKKRIKYMYENGKDSTALIQVMASEDISASLNQYEYAEKITEYDRNQLEAYAQNIKAIEQTIIKLENEKIELEKLQEDYNNKQEEINVLLAEKKDSVKNLDKKIADAVKKAEAEKKRKEEERKKKEQQAALNAANGAGVAGNTTNTTETTTPSVGSGASSASGNQIVSLAMQYVGTPYMSGGASPSGFDCSGFTSYIHSQFGISVPRSSGSQAYGGVGVSLSDIQPGDIVCYPGHVGIYIGNNQIVHATVPGDVVRVANIYYASYATIIAVRRYY